MGWAEIGLGPRAKAKVSERAGQGGGGSQVVRRRPFAGRARARLDRVLRRARHTLAH